MSAHPTLTRQALGDAASLGALYDARTDSFVSLSLLKRPPPSKAVTTIHCHDTDSKYISHDSYKDKLKGLDIGVQLGASFLAGLISVQGSGKYLAERQESSLVAQRSLIYNIKTINEKLEFQSKEVEDRLSWEAVDTGAATHVVSEIIWGSRNIITARRTFSNVDDTKAIQGALDARLSFWKTFKLSGQGQGSFANVDQSSDESLEITVFGDVLANDGTVPTDLESAHHFLKNVPKYVASANEGKGKPLIYKLMPLSLLSKVMNRKTSIPLALEGLETESFAKFVQAFDDLASVRQELHDYRALLQEHRDYVPQDHIRSIGNKISEVRNIETKLQGSYARKLRDIRSGHADKADLWQLLEEFESANPNIHEPLSIMSAGYREKIRLLDGLIAKGANYVGFNGGSLDLELIANPDVEIYVLHFSEAARLSDQLWNQSLVVIHKLLNDSNRQAHIVLKDHDAFDEPLDTPQIELVRNAEIVIPDVLEDRKLSSKKCYAQFDEAHIDIGRPKPLRAIAVEIPCPKLTCAPFPDHHWECSRCNAHIEYGHIDNILYCNCGGCEYKWWTFRCSNSQHGLNFHDYEETKLLEHLKALEPFEELNILILGATGVGKSTWVNAFVNYLTFPTLDDALAAEKLCWIIPFAFSTYDRSDDGEFQKIKVSFGFGGQHADDSVATKVSVEERDGTKGESATQRATVHRVQIGKRLVRLIDTPGIGDTRGASYDKKNMADILQVLRTYNKLHGILVLLKPNEPRLSIMFRFCVKELLTHLHRDAARNIAFGFTNTRGSSYTPGDTFDPLQSLLDEYKEVDIGLRQRNVYCFDSESFRYLAAQKQHNKSLGYFEETRSSWKYSVNESKRLLDRFQSIKPHEVNSTVNLYETRRRVVQMTEPMAHIAEAIKSSIAVNQGLLEELNQHDLTKQDLEKKLKILIKFPLSVPVDYPRTTCSHESCVEYPNTGAVGLDGNPILAVVYRSFCHDPCYLDNIVVDLVENAGLRECWALHGREVCRVCGHRWNTHLHIRHEYQDGTKEIDNPAIVASLKSNATLRENQMVAITSMEKVIEELEVELKKIRVATAQFSIFLARNAIVPINDATLAYLDQQIEQEQGKVQAGGSEDKCKRLKQYRDQYKEEVKTLEENMKKGEDHKLLDQAGVEKLVQKLYALPHYGEHLRRIREVVDDGQVTIPREKAHIVQAKPHWTGEVTSRSGTVLSCLKKKLLG